MSDQSLHTPAGAATLQERAKRRPVLVWVWWVVPAAWAALIGLAFYFDQQVVTAVVARREVLGDWLNWGLILTGVAIFTQGLRSIPNGTRLMIGLLAPVGAAAAITYLLKIAVGRARPFLDLGPASFERWRLEGGDYASFPSGHTEHAFVLATIWALHWPKLRWVGAFWAPLVAFERIYSAKHFLSDVLTGAAIGVVTTLFVVKLLGPRFYRMDAGDANPMVNAGAQDAEVVTTETQRHKEENR